MVESVKPLSEGSLIENGWTVKQFSFDAAIEGDDASAFGMYAGGDFFNRLSKFIEENYGMEMVGDHINVEDMTEQYENYFTVE